MDLHIAAGFGDIHSTMRLAGGEYAKAVFLANENHFSSLIEAHRNDETWDTLSEEIASKLEQEYDLLKAKDHIVKLAPEFIQSYSQELIDAYNSGFSDQFEAIIESRLSKLGV